MKPKLIPTAVEPPRTTDDDPRIGQLLTRSGGVPNPRAALIGFPSDEGVRRNGGRPGAAAAPDAVRAALYRLTPGAEDADKMLGLLDRTVDLGNLDVSGNVEADQQALAEVVAPLLADGIVPLIIGGGHETSYGHFLAYVEIGRRVGIVNWDAHPDVREVLPEGGHSGSPFRQALTHPSGLCEAYNVVGLLPHTAAPAHLKWLRERGGDYIRADEVMEGALAEIEPGSLPILASFDLDAVDAAFAPGVSAPATGGIQPTEWIRGAFEAGLSNRVASMDVVETNPAFDPDGRTVRLAAATLWYFLLGLAERTWLRPL